MNILLNLALFIGAIQGIDAAHKWYERLIGGITHFLGFHLAVSYVVGRQIVPDKVDTFFINLYSYVKIFDGPDRVLPIFGASAAVYLGIILFRKYAAKPA